MERSTLTNPDNETAVTGKEVIFAESGGGVKIERVFTSGGDGQRIDPVESVAWEFRDATISAEGGTVVFEQKDVEVPAEWSQLATNVVASKYFRGAMGTPERETSVKQLVGRVVGSVRTWGLEQGYFESTEDADVFADELLHLLIEQKAAFNSPVWFNVGVEEHPQCSACFILSVQDTMESILDWYRREGVIFKGGSGSGVNLSRIRSSKELLGGGGTASGPVSFHAGGRCLRRRDQIRRQDAARSQDGRARHRASRYRGFRHLQGR